VPQSLSSILIHLMFSTKNREPWIRAAIESELFAYGTTVLKNAGCPTLAMNGTADHIHALLNLSRTKSMAQIVEELKTSTSKWIKTKGPDFRGFHWQAGYGAFSVSPSKVEDVIEYIRRQKEHHCGQSFQDEFRALLERHKISFDERYVWDLWWSASAVKAPRWGFTKTLSRPEPGAMPLAYHRLGQRPTVCPNGATRISPGQVPAAGTSAWDQRSTRLLSSPNGAR